MKNLQLLLSLICVLLITVQNTPQKVNLEKLEINYQECVGEYIDEMQASSQQVQDQFTNYEETHQNIQNCKEFFERKNDQQSPINEENMDIEDLVNFYYCKRNVFFEAAKEYGRGTLQYKIYFCDFSKVEQTIQSFGHDMNQDIESIGRRQGELEKQSSSVHRVREGDYIQSDNLLECMNECQERECDTCEEQFEEINNMKGNPCVHIERLQQQNIETGFSNEDFYSQGLTDLMKSCFRFMKHVFPQKCTAAEIVQCKNQCLDEQISKINE